MDLRTLLAAGLGIALGVLLVAYPEVVIRAHTAGRVPRDRGGEYGAESDSPDRWRRLVRLVGLATVLVGIYLGVR